MRNGMISIAACLFLFVQTGYADELHLKNEDDFFTKMIGVLEKTIMKSMH